MSRWCISVRVGLSFFNQIMELNLLCLFAEGVIMAIEHPVIAKGSTAVEGIVLLKSNLISFELFYFVVLCWISLSLLY